MGGTFVFERRADDLRIKVLGSFKDRRPVLSED